MAGAGAVAGPVALLLDADNLSSPELVAQALQHLTQSAGPVTVRRAYGSAESLKGLAPVLRQLAFRLCANLPLTKNTTDMALAVDAMGLCAERLPAVLAIGTGDADFAPLALRLREYGVRTVCYAQANKMAPEVHAYYDDVVLLGARAAQATAVPAPAPAPARKSAARKTTARKTTAKAAPGAPVGPAPAPAAARGAARDADLSQRVQALLREIPGIAQGQSVEFGEVIKRLRDAQLLGRSAQASRFLKKHVPGVELTPASQPHKLRWTDDAA